MADQQHNATTRLRRKDRLETALAGLLLGGSALVFAVAGDAPHVLALAVLGLLASLGLSRPLSRSPRAYTYLVVGAIALTVLGNQFFQIQSERFFALPIEFYSPLLIYFGVGLTFFRHRESTVAAILAAAVLSMMLNGNVMAYAGENKAWPISQFWFDHYGSFYMAVVFIQVWPLVGLLYLGQRKRGRVAGVREPGVRRRRVFPVAVGLLSLVLILGGVWRAHAVLARYESRLHRLFSGLLQDFLPDAPSREYFPDEISLWRTAPDRLRNDRRVVARAISSRPPGYLRARAYDTYRGGFWRISWRDEPTALHEFALASDLVPIRFSLRDPHEPGKGVVTIESLTAGEIATRVYPTGIYADRYLLAPGNVESLTAIAESVVVFPEGMFFGESWNSAAGYLYGASEYAFMSAWPEPREFAYETDRERYLFVAPGLRQILERIAERRVFADLPENADYDQVLAALRRFYAESFAYDLTVRDFGRDHGRRGRGRPARELPGHDPVLRFLLETRRGHCEMFATATALLLRTRGIPTRYVVGFVGDEAHPHADYWVVRRRDAHAWVEAYVPEKDGWVLVETTPGDGIPGGDSGFFRAGAYWDWLLLQGRRLLAFFREGRLVALVGRGGRALVRGAVWLFRPGSGMVVVAGFLCGLAVWLIWGRHRIGRSRSPLARLQRQRLRLEARAAACGVRRTREMTLRELIAALESGGRPEDQDGLAVLVELLQTYESLRYRAPDPSLAAVAAFKLEVDSGLSRRKLW